MSTQFFGHQRQVGYLNKVLQKGTLAHAYLFYGPENVGKFTLAKLIAKYFYCEQAVKILENDCHQCLPCRQIDSDTHPQVALLDLDHTLTSKKEIRKDIPIEDIRELKHVFAFAPESGKKRIAIINQADKMSEGAANAFLKLLEEPGEESLFILISPSQDLLPQTIVSRAQPIAFYPLSSRQMFDFLGHKVQNPRQADELVRYSSGRPGRAISYLENTGDLEKEKKFIADLEALLFQKEIPDIFVFSEKASQDEDLKRKTAEYSLRLMRRRLLQEKLPAKSSILVKQLKNMERINSLMETTNVNPRLALDAMLLEAKGVNI